MKDPSFRHITPVFQQLYRQPVKFHILFKVLLHTLLSIRLLGVIALGLRTMNSASSSNSLRRCDTPDL